MYDWDLGCVRDQFSLRLGVRNETELNVKLKSVWR